MRKIKACTASTPARTTTRTSTVKQGDAQIAVEVASIGQPTPADVPENNSGRECCWPYLIGLARRLRQSRPASGSSPALLTVKLVSFHPFLAIFVPFLAILCSFPVGYSTTRIYQHGPQEQLTAKFPRLYMDGWRDGLNRLWRDGVTILPRPAKKNATAKNNRPVPVLEKKKTTPPRPSRRKKKR